MEIIFSLLIYLLSLNVFSYECSLENKILKLKVKHENTIEKDLEIFSQKKAIQNEAELILTKLIKSQSLILKNWIKERNLDPEKEPDKLAYEWFKYYAKMFVINTYPKNSSAINDEIDLFFKQLINKNFDKKTKKKIDTLFNDAKLDSIATITNSPLSLTAKNQIIDKIKAIKIYIPEDLKNSKFKNHPLEFFDWSLAYDPKNNEINVGLKSSLYDLKNFKIALYHEIAHSFDSCRWSQENQTEWPFEKVGNCLRTIAAKRDDSRLQELISLNKLTTDEGNFFKNNLTCNNSIYPPIGTQSDQLPETFADWFSAEVANVKSIDNDFRVELCIDQKLNPGSSYLANQERLNKIYFSHPKFQKKLKVKSSETYCTL